MKKKIELEQIAEERAEILIGDLLCYTSEEERESISVEFYVFDEDVVGLTDAHSLTEDESSKLRDLLRGEYITRLEEKGYFLSQNGGEMQL